MLLLYVCSDKYGERRNDSSLFFVSDFFVRLCCHSFFFLFGFVFDRLRPASPCVCFVFVGTSSYGGHWWWVRRVYSPPVPTRTHTHKKWYFRNEVEIGVVGVFVSLPLIVVVVASSGVQNRLGIGSRPPCYDFVHGG